MTFAMSANYIKLNGQSQLNLSKTEMTFTKEKICPVQLKISGMVCSACSTSIKNGLKHSPGVNSVDVSLISEKAYINYDKEITNVNLIIQEIEDLGFEAKEFNFDDSLGSFSLLIENLDFFHDYEDKIKKCLDNIAGILSFAIKKDINVLTLHYDFEAVGIRDIVFKIESQGFNCSPYRDEMEDHLKSLNKKNEIDNWRKSIIFCIWFVVPEFFMAHIFPYTTIYTMAVNHCLFPGLFIQNVIEFFLCSPIQFSIGVKFLKSAFASIKHSTWSMDILVALGSFSAYSFSIFSIFYSLVYPNPTKAPVTFFDTSAMLLTFICLGKYLENKAKGNTATALCEFYKLKPQSALLVTEEGCRTIPIEYIHMGDVLRVLPGERIPADGVVHKGKSYVDESLLTGESVPVLKESGEKVNEGSLLSNLNTQNEMGSLDIKVSALGQNTTLNQIIRLVEEAQISQAPIQSFADKVSQHFVPSIIILAIFTFAIWMAILYESGFEPGSVPLYLYNTVSKFEKSNISGFVLFFIALKIAISVLVVACPCALGLATPSAVMVGTGLAAKHGILIKHAKSLECAKSLRNVVFDKTGTLTEGRPTVSDIYWIISPESEAHKEFVLKAISSCESSSSHPFAVAITEYCSGNFTDLVDFIYTPGSGSVACGTFENESFKVIVGSLKFVKTYFNFSSSEASTWDLKQCKNGNSVVYGAVLHPRFNGLLSFALEDNVRGDSNKTVNLIKSFGIDVYLVTGDKWETAWAVAKKCGIEENRVFANVSPKGKREIIESLQAGSKLHENNIAFKSFDISECQIKSKSSLWESFSYSKFQHQITAMVGDGINDSPALAQADLGIALSGGSNISMQVADMIIVNGKSNSRGNLILVAKAIDIGRFIYKRIIMNFIWAFLYNILMIPIAACMFASFHVFLDPSLSALAMSLSSVSVVLSSLMIKRYRWKY